LIRVVLQLWHLGRVLDASQTGVLANVTEALCEDDELVAREVIFLDRFTDDFF
jgi:hypothetical protein